MSTRLTGYSLPSLIFTFYCNNRKYTSQRFQRGIRLYSLYEAYLAESQKLKCGKVLESGIMKWKFEQWWSSVPAILTKHTTTSHIKALNTEEKKQVLAGDRHKNVPCLNQLKEPQLFPFIIGSSTTIVIHFLLYKKNNKKKSAQICFHSNESINNQNETLLFNWLKWKFQYNDQYTILKGFSDSQCFSQTLKSSGQLPVYQNFFRTFFNN